MNANREQVEIFYEIDDYKEMALFYNSGKIPQTWLWNPLYPAPSWEIDPIRGSEFEVFVAHMSL